MRRDVRLARGERQNALWGRRGENRGNALWGSGKRRMVLLAVAATLVVPVAGSAAPRSASNHTSATDQTLLQLAAAITLGAPMTASSTGSGSTTTSTTLSTCPCAPRTCTASRISATTSARPGVPAARRSTGFSKPELAAPGRYMLGAVPAASTMPLERPDRVVGPGYMWMSGTSFASPVVAGAAADLLALHPGWTPDQVKGALMASARALPAAAPGSVGVGEVKLDAAAPVPAPPNPNLALEKFLVADPLGGSTPVFDAASWAEAARECVLGQCLLGGGFVQRRQLGRGVVERRFVGHSIVGRCLLGRRELGRRRDALLARPPGSTDRSQPRLTRRRTVPARG
jgi:hypothetical protein